MKWHIYGRINMPDRLICRPDSTPPVWQEGQGLGQGLSLPGAAQRWLVMLPLLVSAARPYPHLRRGATATLVILLLLASGRAPSQVADTKAESITHLASVPPDATNGLGVWIWTRNMVDRQTCRLWKDFDIPYHTKVTSARMKMTVDDGYQLFLDGRELGQGANWRGLTEYDLTLLLNPGHHVIAVECFNDLFLAGLILDLSIQLDNGKTLDIKSDESWRVAPLTQKNWEKLKRARPEWPAATDQSTTDRAPYLTRGHWPDDYMQVPRFQPLVLPFWQTGWFHLLFACVSVLVLLVCVLLSLQVALHGKEQRLLNLERARIARDIHDDFGTRLTRLVLESEVAQNELPEHANARQQFARISDGLRQSLEAMDEVLWAVNPRRDTVSDFVTYVCEYAQNFLQSTSIQCLLEVEPDMPPLEFDLPLRRSLFLAVKEAINNAAKHSHASQLLLNIRRADSGLTVVVEDNGRGFDPAQISGKRHGIGNMIQRMEEVEGRCIVVSAPGRGCRLEFSVPLTRQHSRLGWLGRRWRRSRANENKPTPP
ncbi:MAG TPA: ATP-binding protein [Verrucomicrobiae bacterium]